MKKIMYLVLALWGFANPLSAQVDSFYWNNAALPHTFYAKIQLGQGNQLKYVDQFFNGDTLFIDIIFTHCSAPATLYHWDSLMTIPLSTVTPQYNLMTRFAFDSNTITSNGCYVHPRLYDTIFSYFIPVGVQEHSMMRPSVLAWPNPASSTLRLQGLKNEGQQLLIFNALGQLLLRKTYQDGLDVSSLSPGLYFFRLDGDSGMGTGYFLKQ